MAADRAVLISGVFLDDLPLPFPCTLSNRRPLDDHFGVFLSVVQVVQVVQVVRGAKCLAAFQMPNGIWSHQCQGVTRVTEDTDCDRWVVLKSGKFRGVLWCKVPTPGGSQSRFGYSSLCAAGQHSAISAIPPSPYPVRCCNRHLSEVCRCSNGAQNNGQKRKMIVAGSES
jgi:hypothetical protein